MILFSEISYSGDFVPCVNFLLSILTCLVTIGKELTIQPIANRQNIYKKWIKRIPPKKNSEVTYTVCSYHVTYAFQSESSLSFFFFFSIIGIHSIKGRTATTRHGVTRKRSTKRLKHTGNLFRKNLQLKDAS